MHGVDNIFPKSKIYQNIVIRKKSSLEIQVAFAIISKDVKSVGEGV